MTQRILFGTTNQSKVKIVRAFLEGLPVELLSLAHLGIRLDVLENGFSPEENAEKKARAYAAASRMPTFAIDAGLTIQGFPPEKQPGVFVRRIDGTEREVSDAEILAHYRRELDRIGGSAPGVWKIALAFALTPESVPPEGVPPKREQTQTFSFEVLMTSKMSGNFQPGTPLDSLMIDPRTGKYYSEIEYRERSDSDWVRDTVLQNLRTLGISQEIRAD